MRPIACYFCILVLILYSNLCKGSPRYENSEPIIVGHIVRPVSFSYESEHILRPKRNDLASLPPKKVRTKQVTYSSLKNVPNDQPIIKKPNINKDQIRNVPRIQRRPIDRQKKSMEVKNNYNIQPRNVAVKTLSTKDNKVKESLVNEQKLNSMVNDQKINSMVNNKKIDSMVNEQKSDSMVHEQKIDNMGSEQRHDDVGSEQNDGHGKGGKHSKGI